jgi:hypothetical protein
MIAGNPTKIWPEYLSHLSLEHYRYTKVLWDTDYIPALTTNH